VAGAAGSQGARQRILRGGGALEPKSSGGGGLEATTGGGGGLEVTTGGGEARERRLREAAVPEREASREIWGEVRSRVRDPYGHGVRGVENFGRVQPCPSQKLESSFSTRQG
jgi:hypothetical protein